jgi:HEAT repeat protein
MTVFQEKSIKFIGKSKNPAADEILLKLLNNQDSRFRHLAFNALYVKRNPALNLQLFKQFLNDEDSWWGTEVLSGERLAKLTEAAFREQGGTYRDAAVQITLKYKLYEMLPTFVLYLEGTDKALADSMKEMILQLAELFYADILAAPEQERRNFDRKRDWFVQQLDGPVKRYAVNNADEVLKSLLIITKKSYDTMLTITADHRSAAAKRVAEFLRNGDHGSFIRLLLTYVDDPASPPLIDEIIAARSDAVFVRKLLEIVGVNPSSDFREALKRFHNFVWFTAENPQLSSLVEGLEPCAVQLLQSVSFPKDRVVRLYRFFLERQSVDSRRAAAESVRRLVGEEINAMLLQFLDNSDAQTAATLFRILKSRGVEGVDDIMPKLVERPEPLIRQAVYEMMPDLHVESFASRIGQLTHETAKRMGRLVRLVDPSTHKVIVDDIDSPIPIRRAAACSVAAVTGFSSEFMMRIIQIAEEDSEIQVRCAAIAALGTLMAKDVIESLKRLTNDRSTDIRNAANSALKEWVSIYQAQTQATS